MVKDSEILDTLRPVLSRYAAERKADESFGDWIDRAFWTSELAA